MTKREPNKKLAEWAGFTDAHKGTDKAGISYWTPETYPHKMPCPNFIESLAACFKWLVPKLKGYSLAKPTYTGVNIFMAYYEDNAYEGVDPIASYALSLAIEKLIDSEVK